MSTDHESVSPTEHEEPDAPLVPLLPVLATIGYLGVLATLLETDAAADSARRVARELEAVVGGLGNDFLDFDVAVRESGLSVETLLEHLRALGTVIEVAEVADHEIRRIRLWMIAAERSRIQCLRSMLFPSEPLLDLIGDWLVETHSSETSPGGADPLALQRRKSIAVVAKLINSLLVEQISLAQAARESGESPDALLGYLRSGDIENHGDQRSPLIRRRSLFNSRSPLREADQGED